MNSLPVSIKRFGPPNDYDHYPYGTICEVSDGSTYKQISKDEEHPIWMLLYESNIDNL